MLDVRIPHVHAPHGEVGGWRGFATHVAVIAVGLLLALGLEQCVEYVHHEFQRATIESQMRETFQANLRRAESDIRVMDGYRAFLIELQNAVSSRIGGGSDQAPSPSDSRNNPFAPPPNLGSYEALKANGSIGLLDLNRIRLYDRIEFQHEFMLRSFYKFIDSAQELDAFSKQFSSTDEFHTYALPSITKMSADQLVEYRALLAKLIIADQSYSGQLQLLKRSYGLMLRGIDDVNILMDASDPRQRSQ
jgi:hypothetical protein